MKVDTVDVEILLLDERASKKRDWPWLKFYAKDLNERRILTIHYYPWECAEDQTLEEQGKYTLDIFKHENEKYWRLARIRAGLV